MSEILFLKPVFKSMIWGGDRLAKEFAYEIPSDTTGECWAVSAHENGDCMVENGVYAGQPLSSLWKDHRELFGNVPGDKFPLLIKIIDAKQDLSIQVHPDDAYAKVNENGSLGKTECWYILDAEKGGKIVIGHNAKDKDEMKCMIQEKRWNDFIRTVPVKKGDFLQIDPGTVHAIKGGTLILETQQNSDITYRVYDYDRLSNGQPRELHIEKSIDVIRCPYEEKNAGSVDTKYCISADCSGESSFEKLISCSYYSVYKAEVDKKVCLNITAPFVIASVTNGEGTIDGTALKKGQHMILPAGYTSAELTGNMQLILSHI